MKSSEHFQSIINAYKKVLEGVDAGIVDPSKQRAEIRDGCGYKHVHQDGSVTMCGVGILLSEEFRQKLINTENNFTSVQTLALEYGWGEFTQTTNLSPTHMAEMQSKHDSYSTDGFRGWLVEQIGDYEQRLAALGDDE